MQDEHTKPTQPTMTTVLPPAARAMTFREKLLDLYGRFAYIQKTGKNEHHKYKFFEESQMKRKFNLALRELGLVVVKTWVKPCGPVAGGKGDMVVFGLRLEDVRGEQHGNVELEGIGGGYDSLDKGPMKAVVAALKYAMANGFFVETGNDPEADAAGDREVADDLLARITAATDRNALEFLKPELAAQKGGASFGALKDAFKARKEALTTAQ